VAITYDEGVAICGTEVFTIAQGLQGWRECMCNNTANTTNEPLTFTYLSYCVDTEDTVALVDILDEEAIEDLYEDFDASAYVEAALERQARLEPAAIPAYGILNLLPNSLDPALIQNYLLDVPANTDIFLYYASSGVLSADFVNGGYADTLMEDSDLIEWSGNDISIKFNDTLSLLYTLSDSGDYEYSGDEPAIDSNSMTISESTESEYSEAIEISSYLPYSDMEDILLSRDFTANNSTVNTIAYSSAESAGLQARFGTLDGTKTITSIVDATILEKSRDLVTSTQIRRDIFIQRKVSNKISNENFSKGALSFSSTSLSTTNRGTY